MELSGSGGTTVVTLNRYLHYTGAQIVIISETRCGTKNAEKRIKSMLLCNHIIVHYVECAGGLWLVWSDQIKIKVQSIETNWNLIVAWIWEQGQHRPWIFIGVYGDPSRSKQSEYLVENWWIFRSWGSGLHCGWFQLHMLFGGKARRNIIPYHSQLGLL